ncbi:hypothetical protein CCICO_01520 [Corynebacterium ciconiae DSM 44920]|uniref:DUF2262 domain-containing protein n=1 Tax=Corynebacterium ciconiae TaxID=227319 RepID=UPI00035E1663|nr:DUF2262 domain-containing protein [Corynebacterium ciconiae]WKD60358.1 hypothetical protein CCICO_01520 [Corynebacterium ciconiae DSM 44920]
MLSIYHEFPDHPAVQGALAQDEVQFHFMVAAVPQKKLVNDPYAEDKVVIHSMLMPGVALRMLPDGDFVAGVVNVEYLQLFHTENKRTLWDPREVSDMEPFKVYRARGSYFYSEIRQEPYVTVWELLEPLPDPEMEELAERAAEPVIVDTSIGQMVFDRSTNSFNGRSEELGVDLGIYYEGERILLADEGGLSKKFKSALGFVNNVLSQEYLDNARRLGAEKALPTANRWRHEVADAEGRATPAPKLEVDDVYAKLTPTAVIVPHRGNILVEFDDGYMFGGHPLTVKTKRDGTPTSIDL